MVLNYWYRYHHQPYRYELLPGIIINISDIVVIVVAVVFVVVVYVYVYVYVVLVVDELHDLSLKFGPNQVTDI